MLVFLHQQNRSPYINWTEGFGTTKFIWCPSEAQSTNSAMIEFYNDSYSSTYIQTWLWSKARESWWWWWWWWWCVPVSQWHGPSFLSPSLPSLMIIITKEYLFIYTYSNDTLFFCSLLWDLVELDAELNRRLRPYYCYVILLIWIWRSYVF